MRLGLQRDSAGSSTMALLFGLSLGISGLALPLLAIGSGYGATEVGLLYSLSAVTQIATRIKIGTILRRVADRTIIAVAAVALSLSFLVVLGSAGAAELSVAWALQGFARAFFWTGSQTHVVRGPGSSVSAVATLNFFGSVGLLVGPVIAGALVETSASTALLIGAAVCAAALVPISTMERYAPFAPVEDRSGSSLWRRPGVDAACGAGLVAGAWRGLLDSLVPVVLQGAGQSAGTTGALVGVANAASVAGAVVIGRIRQGWTQPVYVASMFSAAVGLGALGLAAGHLVAAGVVLAVAGLGAGALQTLAPALAATSVHPDERGDAIATAGIVRTIAMSVTPLAVSGAVLVVPVAAALAIAGGALSLPAAAARSLSRLREDPGPP